MHKNFIFAFKRAFHLSTLAINFFNNSSYKVVLTRNYYQNPINRSPFKYFTTHTTHPLLKLIKLVLWCANVHYFNPKMLQLPLVT